MSRHSASLTSRMFGTGSALAWVVGVCGWLIATYAIAAPQIVRPAADGTLADGGVYGPFDGVPDNWDWTFNQSSYEGAVTLSVQPGAASLEQRVVWEYSLASVSLEAPVTATLHFTLRGAAVYPMSESSLQVLSYPADLLERTTDFSAGPAVLLGSVTVAAFQPATAYALNVSNVVSEALTSGSRKVAFRFQAAPGGASATQAFFDASDSNVASKPYLSIDAGSAGVPPALVTTAVSRRTNAGAPGGFCDLPLLPARASEPRSGGITELRIGFDVVPGTPEGSGVSLEEATCAAPTFAPYSGQAVISSSVTNNELIVRFSPALENARTYSLNLGPSITSTPGQSVEVRALVGDVNGSGRVDALDRSAVIGVWTGAGFSCATDLNSSGRTDALDRAMVIGAWTGAAHCAP